MHLTDFDWQHSPDRTVRCAIHLIEPNGLVIMGEFGVLRAWGHWDVKDRAVTLWRVRWEPGTGGQPLDGSQLARAAGDVLRALLPDVASNDACRERQTTGVKTRLTTAGRRAVGSVRNRNAR